jgi:hypothetical protein
MLFFIPAQAGTQGERAIAGQNDFSFIEGESATAGRCELAMTENATV